MELEFSGRIFEWRGPAPYLFVAVPDDESDAIAAQATMLSYGWGVIPAEVVIGRTTFSTALFPKDGGYLVPIKVAVRRAEGIDEGDLIDVRLRLGDPR